MSQRDASSVTCGEIVAVEARHWHFFITFNSTLGEAAAVLFSHGKGNAGTESLSILLQNFAEEHCRHQIVQSKTMLKQLSRRGLFARESSIYGGHIVVIFFFFWRCYSSVQNKAPRQVAHNHSDQGLRSGTWLKMLVPQFFKVANRRLSVQILLVIPQRPLFCFRGQYCSVHGTASIGSNESDFPRWFTAIQWFQRCAALTSVRNPFFFLFFHPSTSRLTSFAYYIAQSHREFLTVFFALAHWRAFFFFSFLQAVRCWYKIRGSLSTCCCQHSTALDRHYGGKCIS